MFVRTTFERLKYYIDVRLLFQILLVSIKVSLMFYRQRNKGLIRFANPKRFKTRSGDKDKITRYVDLCLRLRGKVGLRDTCLTRSIILCHMLRKYRIDAKVNFGTDRNEENEIGNVPFIGHCWVTVGQEEIPTTYQLIYRYP